MHKRKRDEGFTLIELMIVIAVIGILAVVLIPKIGNVKTSAKLTGVQSNYQSVLATVQAGQSYYATESVSDYLVGIYGSNITTAPPTTTGVVAMQNPLDGYYGCSSTTVTPTSAPAVVCVSSALSSTSKYDNYEGSVVVYSQLSNGTGTVTVYAMDNNGNIMMQTDLSF